MELNSKQLSEKNSVFCQDTVMNKKDPYQSLRSDVSWLLTTLSACVGCSVLTLVAVWFNLLPDVGNNVAWALYPIVAFTGTSFRLVFFLMQRNSVNRSSRHGLSFDVYADYYANHVKSFRGRFNLLFYTLILSTTILVYLDYSYAQ